MTLLLAPLQIPGFPGWLVLSALVGPMCALASYLVVRATRGSRAAAEAAPYIRRFGVAGAIVNPVVIYLMTLVFLFLFSVRG